MLRSKKNEIRIHVLENNVYKLTQMVKDIIDIHMNETMEELLNDRKQMDKHSNAKKASQKNKVQ